MAKPTSNTLAATLSPDPTGEVIDGVLTVRGLSVPIELRYYRVGEHRVNPQMDLCSTRYTIRNRTLTNDEKFQACRASWSLKWIDKGAADILYDVPAPEPLEFVDKGYRGLLFGMNGTLEHWLILKPSERVAGAYERIGYLCHFARSDGFLRENAETIVMTL
ncbi:hypothetical protein H2201_009281, partial [Coniosporium apollinis]